VPAIVGIITDSRGYIADVWFRDSWEQSDANAHLIAAAPDLLAACKLALAQDADDDTIFNALAIAVAKAEGRNNP
jgi:hypothetical protein